MATVGQLDLPDLLDHPYHPDAKVVFPKRTFGVTILASLRPRYHIYTSYFPLKLCQRIACDSVTSGTKPVFPTGPLVKSWRRH